MEESKKGMSPILMAVLVLAGSCLLAVGLWYGLNYFKGEDKPVDTPTEETNNGPTNNGAEDLSIFNSKSVAVEIETIPSVDNLYANFDNVKKDLNGVSVVYSCNQY